MLRPCPRCATPSVVAAIDQLDAALDQLDDEQRSDVERALVRLLRLVAHGQSAL
jgi:hypothetical protein